MKIGAGKCQGDVLPMIHVITFLTLFFSLASAVIQSSVEDLLISSAIHEVCTSSEDCPAHSTCRPSGCDGYNCLCDKEYVASPDRTICMKASRIGEKCDFDSRCISEYASCKQGTCTCLDGFIPTNDGRCKLPGTSFVGENCGTCEYPAVCSNGVCKCTDEYRPLTIDEFWLDPLNILQCRPKDYHMAKCNGTALKIPEQMLNEIQALGTPAPHLGHHDWSLILPEKEIYGACSDQSQCPSNSKCRPSSCDGFLCLCNPGYIASLDRTRCMKAQRIGERCDARSDECISPFATCNITCSCMPGFLATQDGRCKIKGSNYIGEKCNGDGECEYPGTCKDGVCACVPPQRKLTEKEFWLDPTLAIQCRREDYSVWLCNGTDIEFPSQLSDEMSAELIAEMVADLGHNHEHHDHGHDTENNGPTILVDVETKETDEFLIPINVAAVLAVIGLAVLIALIFRAKRKQALQMRSSSSNVSSSKSFVPEDEWATAPKAIRIPRPGLTLPDSYDDDVFTVSTLERERRETPYDSHAQWSTRQLPNEHQFDTSHVVLCESAH